MKRVFDLLSAGLLLVLLMPILVVLAAAIAFAMGTPVLFEQTRPGFKGRPFRMVKFRTMRDARRADGSLLPDSERLTALGRFLRSASLDELPELWNVFRGDMSLVGPRPLLMDYLALYSTEQNRRHDVRPGITGWAQVNGRNSVPWPERLAMDVWYVDHRSMMLDLRILFMTVGRVLRRSGISEHGEATMTAFRGER